MAAPWSIVWDRVLGTGITLGVAEVPAYYATFVVLAVFFGGAGLLTASLLRKRSGYQGGSSIAYEGGEQPIGSPWVAFQARYYTLALVFLLFEVEIAFMFPFALVLKGPQAVLGFWESCVFVAVLGLGLVFAWVGGMLTWPSGKQTAPKAWQNTVPQDAYAAILKKPLG